MGRRPSFYRENVYKGSWTPDEDLLLISYIQAHGVGRWRTLPKNAGLNRCGKSCRFRWMNYLRPDIKRGHMSAEEEELIIRLHNLLGNRWSLIARRIPGRTDNEIKNYWNTHLSKRLQTSNAHGCIYNTDANNNQIIHNHSNTGTTGAHEIFNCYLNGLVCMEQYPNSTSNGSTSVMDATAQFGCNGVVGNGGSQDVGLEYSYCMQSGGSSWLSYFNMACDQPIVGTEWGVHGLQALLLGYEFGAAHYGGAFLT